MPFVSLVVVVLLAAIFGFALGMQLSDHFRGREISFIERLARQEASEYRDRAHEARLVVKDLQERLDAAHDLIALLSIRVHRNASFVVADREGAVTPSTVVNMSGGDIEQTE